MILVDSNECAFDTHCHFFNKEILSLRLLVELGMLLSQKKQENAVDGGTISTIKHFLHFLKTGLLSVEAIYSSLEKDEPGFAFCPLMFDLEGCMLPGEDDNAIDERQMIRLIMKEFEGKISSFDSMEWNELREFVKQRENSDQLTSNLFELQEKQLMDLGKQYPGRIYPFFAVDPRRSELFDEPDKQVGIKKIVSRLRANGGLFSGIKLYAPNGYSPADERLLPLYEYCEVHQVPITAHCSAGGFALFSSSVNVRGLIRENGEVVARHGIYRFQYNGLFDSRRVTERANVLNHPKIWDKLLQEYPGLKVNLAHFGSQDSGRRTEWTDCIWEMMHKYPNLYTDFSCITARSELEYMYIHYFKDAEPEVKSRFLYGSDYYLNLLFCDDMKTFLKNFNGIFTREEWRMIATINPRRFLQSGF